MTEERRYPREWLKQIEAVVFASLVRGEIRLVLHSGSGLAQGGAAYDVAIETVPAELRVPNTKVWVQLDDNMKVLRVWRRE
jgi:hypothetical protein